MTKALVTTEIQAVATKPAAKAAAVQAIQPRPDTIVISEMTHVALAVAAHLIRVGYVHSPFVMPVIFQATGHATLTMIRGNVDAHAVALAEAAEAHAVALQQIDFQKEVEAAAARMIEQAAKTAKQAEIAAVLAAQQAQIAKLTAEMNA
jgi:hypothetical protein